MNATRLFRRIPLVALLFLTPLLLCAQSYILTDLGTLGGPESVAYGINMPGHVVGTSQVSDEGVFHAFKYRNRRDGMVDLGTLPGGTSSAAYAINESGSTVGEAGVAGDTATHAFLNRGGFNEDLGTLGGANSSAEGINSSGVIVGWSEMGDGTEHAFSYAGGMIDLGTAASNEPGKTYTDSVAYAINDPGQIVGELRSVDPVSGDLLASRAFFYSGGAMTSLGTLGGEHSSAQGINNSGFVVGSSETETGEIHAFVYRNDTEGMVDLGTLGGSESVAYAINNPRGGQIVGQSTLPGGATHAFLYSGGAMKDLNDLVINASDWELVDARGINSRGEIAGSGIAPDGETRAFLLTPRPGASSPPVADSTPDFKAQKLGALKKQLAKARKIKNPKARANFIKRIRAQIRALNKRA